MTTVHTTAIDAPIRSVTLFEDRASVLRAGSVQIEPGRHRLTLPDVAPVVADRSLRVEPKDDPSCDTRVLDFRVKRELIVRKSDLPPDQAALHEEERQRSRELGATKARRVRRQAERDAVRAAAELLLTELAEDAGWGRGEPERWRSELDLLREREATLDQEILALADGLEDAEAELADLRRRLIVTRDHAITTWIEIEVEHSGSAPASLEISYLVPCACWRPRYRATLGAEPSHSLHLEVQAAVWQHTGEDWTDALLRFSTQRPSLGTEPPLLAEDRLRAQPKQEQVVVELREQDIQTTGLGQQRGDQAHELPGVDDGGEPLHLEAAHRATVPSDGRPYRVTIGHSRAEASLERVVMAERHSAVLLRCTSTNAAPHPLLAGPVDLIASSGRVGRTELSFVAPGERLELGFGPDPSLRVFRRAEQVEQEQGVLSRWQTTDHRVELKLSNLGDTPRRVLVIERIPVSELEQIRIELRAEGTTAANTPDSDGFLRWERELAAGAIDTVELAYKVMRRSNVVDR